MSCLNWQKEVSCLTKEPIQLNLYWGRMIGRCLRENSGTLFLFFVVIWIVVREKKKDEFGNLLANFDDIVQSNSVRIGFWLTIYYHEFP